MIKDKSLPPIQEAKKMDDIHQKLNPKRPTKKEQAKLKSPIGFVMKPKYPEFMLKK
jgi:xanthine/CO dehydrogenase XdhC/CoxF family maturation factor